MESAAERLLKESNDRHLLLRSRCEGTHNRTAEKCDELAPFHLIASIGRNIKIDAIPRAVGEGYHSSRSDA